MMSGATGEDVCRICSLPCSRSNLLQHLEDYHRVNLYDQYVLDTIYEVAVSVPEKPYRPQICLIAGPPKVNGSDEDVQYIDQSEVLNYSGGTINLDETPQALEEDVESNSINGWNDQIEDEGEENNDDDDIKIKAIVKPLRNFEVDVQPTMNGEVGTEPMSQYYGKENQPCAVEEIASSEETELPQHKSEIESDEDVDFYPSQMFSTKGKSRRKRKLTERAKIYFNGMTEDKTISKKRKCLEDQSSSDGDVISVKDILPKRQDLEVLLSIHEISDFHLKNERQKTIYEDLYSSVKNKRNRKPTEKAENYFKQVKESRNNKKEQITIQNHDSSDKKIDQQDITKYETPKGTSKRKGKPASRFSEYILFSDKNKSQQYKKGKGLIKPGVQKVIYNYIEEGEEEIYDFVRSYKPPLSSKASKIQVLHQKQDTEEKESCKPPEATPIDKSTSSPPLKCTKRRTSRQTEKAKVYFEELQESKITKSRKQPSMSSEITFSNQKYTTRRINQEDQSNVKEKNENSKTKMQTQCLQDIFSTERENCEESKEMIPQEVKLIERGRRKLSSKSTKIEEDIEAESFNDTFCINQEDEEVVSKNDNFENITLISSPDVLISRIQLPANHLTKIMSGETININEINIDDKVSQVLLVNYTKKVKLKYSDEQGEDIKNLDECSSVEHILPTCARKENKQQLPKEIQCDKKVESEISSGVVSQSCSPVLSTSRAKPNKRNYLYLSARKGRYMCPKQECQFNHISRELVKMHLHDHHNGEGTPKQQELALYLDRQEIANYISQQELLLTQGDRSRPSLITEDRLSEKHLNEPMNLHNLNIKKFGRGKKAEAVNFEDVFHLNKDNQFVSDFGEDIFCCQIINGNGRYRCPECDFHNLSRQVVKNHLKQKHKNGKKISPIHQQLSIYLSQCVKARPLVKLKYADNEGQDIKDSLVRDGKNTNKTLKYDITLNTNSTMDSEGYSCSEADNLENFDISHVNLPNTSKDSQPMQDEEREIVTTDNHHKSNEFLNNSLFVNDKDHYKGEKHGQHLVNETLFVNVDDVPYSDSMCDLEIPKSVPSHVNHANHTIEVQKKIFKIPPLSNETLIAVAVRNLQTFHFQNPNEKSSPGGKVNISNKGVMSKDMAAMLLVTFPAFGSEEQIKNGVLLLFWDDENPQRLKRDLISKLKKKFQKQKEEYRKELLNSMLYPQLLPSLELAFEDDFTHPSAYFKPPYNDVMLGQIACYALVQPATVKQLAIILGLFFPSFKANAGDWILLETELFDGEEFEIVEAENQQRKYKLSEEKSDDILESLQNFTLANLEVVEHSIVDKELIKVLGLT